LSPNEAYIHEYILRAEKTKLFGVTNLYERVRELMETTLGTKFCDISVDQPVRNNRYVGAIT
jgi:hypothetical protein